METLTPSNMILFLAFVMPGFLSMRVYGLLHPVENISLKDNILEAIGFSIVNFAIMSWAILIIVEENAILLSSIRAYFLMLLIFLICPVIWPIMLHFCLKYLAANGIILQRYKTAWDDVFLRREPYWVIVHLKDGRRLGGLYGVQSYATLFPNPGHLYLQELWHLNDAGVFVEKVSGSKGIILRPDDYHLIELFGAVSDGEE